MIKKIRYPASQEIVDEAEWQRSSHCVVGKYIPNNSQFGRTFSIAPQQIATEFARTGPYTAIYEMDGTGVRYSRTYTSPNELAHQRL